MEIDVFGLLIQLFILAFSVVCHEIAHGYAAFRFGDWTAKQAGRLDFNPVVHIDPFGSIILPLLLRLTGSPMIGWAKPVPVNYLSLKPRRAGVLTVALAGVATNLAIATVAALAYRVLPARSEATTLVGYAVVINVWLAVFNLVPVPPLDGSRVVAELLPRHLAERYERIERFGIIILYALLLSGLLGAVISPVANAIIHILV